jgi:hypothetical protein
MRMHSIPPGGAISSYAELSLVRDFAGFPSSAMGLPTSTTPIAPCAL